MPVELRPLGVGEIFDRAVTLYVRNFSLFTIIAAFLVVPTTIARYFLATEQLGSWAQIIDQVQHPHKHAVAATAGLGPWFYITVVLGIVLTPFMFVAVASAVGRLYDGALPDWQSAYRVALRHIGAIIATMISQIVILVVVAFGGAVILGILSVIAVILVRAVAALGVVFIVFTAIYALAFIAAIMLCYLSVALGFDAIAIEGLPFLRAIGSGFARIFNRRQLGRALLVSLAFAAVQIGMMIASVGVASLLEVLRQPFMEAMLQGVLSLISTSFVAILVAVYYFDVRIRGEGLDLQAELDRLQAQPQA